MHEHGREERQKITGGVSNEATRNESPLPNKSVTATLLYKEKMDVQSDQGIRDQRNSSARSIIIAYWEHKMYLLVGLSQVHVKMSLTFFKEGDLLQSKAKGAQPQSVLKVPCTDVVSWRNGDQRAV
jgi:hypothetical protein